MSFVRETFNTVEERNARWELLRKTHPHVVKYSEALKSEKGWRTEFVVAYPPKVLNTVEEVLEVNPPAGSLATGVEA